MRYVIVDVFSDRPLAGNALCVVLDPCPEELMQPVARETNLSETTFVTERGDGAYSMRIFTPGVELPFAGHPTLGTAWVMGPGRWLQTTPGGVIPVTVDGRGAEMVQPDPELTQLDDPELGRALGVTRVEAAFCARAAGNGHVIVLVDEPIERLRVDTGAALEAVDRHNTSTLCAVERVAGGTLHVRLFFRAAPLAEDPGTGSAAGPIGLLARQHWSMAEDILIRQGDGIGRPCRIRVHAESGDLRVAGDVARCAEGEFTL